MHKIICPVCRETFEARRNDAFTCSGRCRARYRRAKAEARARQSAVLLREFALLTPSGDPSLYAALVREARNLSREPN